MALPPFAMTGLTCFIISAKPEEHFPQYLSWHWQS
jgi:hypothetical protein